VVGGERVVGPQLVDPHVLGPVVDRPPRLAEAELWMYFWASVIQ
jgi:hypothetical protein